MEKAEKFFEESERYIKNDIIDRLMKKIERGSKPMSEVLSMALMNAVIYGASLASEFSLDFKDMAQVLQKHKTECEDKPSRLN